MLSAVFWESSAESGFELSKEEGVTEVVAKLLLLSDLI
jgi:hypothetical protein